MKNQSLPQNSVDLDALADRIASRLTVSVSPPPRWMDLKTAAHYAHIGRKKLIALASTKKIYGFQDPGTKTNPWIFDRDSIDRYRLSQGRSELVDDEAVVAGIMEGVSI